MSKFTLIYDKDNNLAATYVTKEGNNVLEGDDLSAFLRMVEQLRNVTIKPDKENDKIVITLNDDNITIIEARKFLMDSRNESFKIFLIRNRMSIYKFLQREEKIPEKTQNEEKPKKKKINRSISITATAVGLSFIIIATALSTNTFENLFDFLASKLPPLSTEQTYENYVPVLLDFSKPVSYEEYYNYLKSNCYNDISKFCKTYGVDPNLILRMACENGSYYINATLPDGRYGLMGLDLEALHNQGAAAYNLALTEKPQLEVIGVDDEMVNNPNLHFKLAAMVFQQRLRMCNYNIMGAIQSMGVPEKVFVERIVQYGIVKYGDGLATPDKTDSYYVNLVMSDQSDTEWLNRFVNQNGETFAGNVISHLGKDYIIQVKVCLDEKSVTTLSYRVQDGVLVPVEGQKVLG